MGSDDYRYTYGCASLVIYGLFIMGTGYWPTVISLLGFHGVSPMPGLLLLLLLLCLLRPAIENTGETRDVAS